MTNNNAVTSSLKWYHPCSTESTDSCWTCSIKTAKHAYTKQHRTVKAKDLLDWMYDNKWKAIAFSVLQP